MSNREQPSRGALRCQGIEPLLNCGLSFRVASRISGRFLGQTVADVPEKPLRAAPLPESSFRVARNRPSECTNTDAGHVPLCQIQTNASQGDRILRGKLS
jgi:hypothetical protein